MFSEKRPTLTTEILVDAAKNNGYPDTEAQEIANEYSFNMDGYDLSIALYENYEWHTTRETVDELDEVIFDAQDKLEKLEFEWVARNKIEPPLSNGTRIREGIIDGTYEHQAARYKVIANGEDATSNSRIIIKFEDAVVVDKQEKAS